jgi:hypothetical protein
MFGWMDVGIQIVRVCEESLAPSLFAFVDSQMLQLFHFTYIFHRRRHYIVFPVCNL